MPPKIVVEVIADPRAYVAGLRTATAETGMFAKNIERMGRGTAAGTLAVTGMGRAIAFASAQFLGGYGLAFALAHSVKAAADFQQQMLLIRTQAGDTSGDIALLSKSVLDMSTQVGTKPEDLAKGLYHIESAGIRGNQALKVLKVAAMGAKIGMDDLENVTNALVAAQKSGLKGTHDMTEAMAELDAITGAGNLRLADLTKALHSGVTGTAKEVGISLKDLGAAIATLTIQGVPAQQAATRLRTSLALMAAPTAKATKELKGIGMTGLQLAQDMRTKGLLPALKDLSVHLNNSGLSATQMTAVIIRAFGAARSSATIIQLLQHLKLLQTSQDRITAGAKQFGDKWHQEIKTAAFNFDQFKAAVSRTEITIGNALIPTLTRAAKHFSDWLGKPENQKNLYDTVKIGVKNVTQFIELVGKAAKAFDTYVLKPLQNIFDMFGVHLNKLEEIIMLLFTVKAVKFLNVWQKAAVAKAKAMTEQQAAAAKEAEAASAAAANGSAAAVEKAATKEVGSAAEVEAAFKSANAEILLSAEATASASAAAWGRAAAAATTAAAEMETAGAGFMAGPVRGLGGTTAEERAAVAAAEQQRAGAGLGGAVYGPGGMVAPPVGYTQRQIEEFRAAEMARGLPEQGPAPARPGALSRFRASLNRLPGEGSGMLGLGMAGRIGMIAGAVPDALMVGLFGMMAYDLTGVILHMTKADKALKLLGGAIAGWTTSTGDLAKTLKGTKPGFPGLRSAIVDAYGRQGEAIFGRALAPNAPNVSPGVLQSMKEQGINVGEMYGKSMQDTLARKKIVAHLMAEFPTMSQHDIEIFLNKLQKQLDTSQNREKLTVEITPKEAHGKALLKALTTPATIPYNQIASFIEQLQLAEATAREQIAAGDIAQKQVLIKLLEKQIAYDEKHYKREEELYKKGGYNAEKHMKEMIKLRNDEASAYSEITSLKTFELPKSIQLAQAQAGVTQTTADDVAASKQAVEFAKSVATNTKKTVDERIAAYNAWQSALQTIQQAEAYQIPHGLQLAALAAQLTTTNADDVKVNEKIAANARKVALNHKRSFADRSAAYQALISAQAVIQAAPPIPMKLQIMQAAAGMTAGQADDIRAARLIKNWALRMIKSGKFKDSALVDLMGIVTSANQTIGQGGGQAMYIAANPRAMTAGLGLSYQARRAMEFRIAEAEAHGGRRPRPGAMGIQGYGVETVTTYNTTVNVHGGDPNAVEAAVHKAITRRQRHFPPTRRGTHPGQGG